MYVEQIDYEGFDDTGTNGVIHGTVAFVSKGRRLAIALTVPRQMEIQDSRHRLLLMAKAIRQARRMPEFREGSRLRFAPGLLPREIHTHG